MAKTVQKGGSRRGVPATGPASIPAVRESEARLRMALESAGMVTWDWDIRSGRVLYSDNMPELVRGPDIEPYGAIDRLIWTIHPEDRKALRRALDRTVRKGVPFELAYRVRMLDNRYHWILGKAKTVLKEGGDPVRVLGISMDVTARKRIEEDLRARSRQLAKLAAELSVVEQRARRQLADLLHENLQQLLVGTRLQVHALSQESPARRRPEWARVDKALEEVLAASSSITRLLAPPVSLQKDLPTALQWLAADMRERYRLAVAVRAPAPLPDLPEAVTVLLFTAARELLLNVVKHSGAMRATLSLRVADGRVEVTVTDPGKGFKARMGRAAGGPPGFGLFSIRERAELLGGRLSLSASSGRGARVTLSLPVRPAA